MHSIWLINFPEISPRLFCTFLPQNLLVSSKMRAEGTSPWEVYDVVTFKARVPCVVSATCKVGRPMYACILVYIMMVSALTSSGVWRHRAFGVSRKHRRVSCFFGRISIYLVLAVDFKGKSTFKSKWQRFWIISLKIWVKINVTKHGLLADEFILYRLICSICSLNAMKCVYIGFSPSKQQSFS